MPNMIGGEKVPEWTIETIDDKRLALKRKGIVVKTFYTYGDLKEWWNKRFGDWKAPRDPGTVLDHAIKRSGW